MVSLQEIKGDIMGVSVEVFSMFDSRVIKDAFDNPLDIMVGYLQETAGEDENGVSNLQKAWANEFGVNDKKIKIPERSFIRSTIVENQDKIYEELARIERTLFGGEEKSIERAQEKLAVFIIGLIKAKMKRSPEWAVANAPYTIEQKKSSVPLIDTGDLRNNLDWKPSNN